MAALFLEACMVIPWIEKNVSCELWIIDKRLYTLA